MARITERLDRLERENHALAEQVRVLQARLDGSDGAPSAAETPPVPLEQRVAIQESRIQEQDQTKVEASQRFPVKLTGILLFNAFMNSKQSGTVDDPTFAAATGPARSGAKVTQSIIGLEYRGPRTFLGGEIRGSVFMDFFGSGNAALRLRTGDVELRWKTRSLMAGVEKPIFNPREPNSLALVGVSPLTGTGNLWQWLPQARFEQDYSFTSATGIRARVGVVQTREIPFTGSTFSGPQEAQRPAAEGRFEIFHNLDDERKLEFAAGFHRSSTHAAGFTTDSSLFSLDWFSNPWRKVEFTGAFYKGQDVAPLGNGIGQGFLVAGRGLRPVHSIGGWGQFTIHAVRRLDFHLFSGQQDDTNRDLAAGLIGKNLLYGGNAYFLLAPNVRLALEATQIRTSYLPQGIRINNHYDLALAYYF
jgi:hypothetical protein